MPDPLKRVSEGDPISADAWNELVDRLRALEGARVVRQRGEVPLSHQRTVVFVQNDSGSDVDRFGVLGIDDVFPTPTDNLNGFKAGPVLHGITPADGTHEGAFVVLLEPAESGKIAAGCIAGVCVVQVDVGDADHTHADIADADSTQLESGWAGSARILWKQSGTGTKWAVVRMGLETHGVLFGKLDGALSQGSSATMSIWDGDPLADTGNNETVYDWYLSTGESIDSGKKVKAELKRGKWYVTAAEC